MIQCCVGLGDSCVLCAAQSVAHTANYNVHVRYIDVITSLVSIVYRGYGSEKVTSQREDEMDLTLTSLRVISMVRGHVILT
jgi:hypothetical protein